MIVLDFVRTLGDGNRKKGVDDRKQENDACDHQEMVASPAR